MDNGLVYVSTKKPSLTFSLGITSLGKKGQKFREKVDPPEENWPLSLKTRKLCKDEWGPGQQDLNGAFEETWLGEELVCSLQRVGAGRTRGMRRV